MFAGTPVRPEPRSCPLLLVLRAPEPKLPIGACPVSALVEDGACPAQVPRLILSLAPSASPFITDGVEEVGPSSAARVLVPCRHRERDRRKRVRPIVLAW